MRTKIRAMRNGFFVETLLNNEIKPIEIGGWANARDWSRKTRNDLLGTLSLLFKDAIKRGFVLANSDDATAIERQKFKCGSLSIMTGKHRRAEDQFKLPSAREDRSGIRGACSEFCRHPRSTSSAQTARVTVSDARKSHLGGRCEASRLALQETKRPARARPQAKLCATMSSCSCSWPLSLRPNGGGVGRHRHVRLCGPGFDYVGHRGTISLEEIMNHRRPGVHIGGQLSGDDVPGHGGSAQIRQWVLLRPRRH